ncbi:FMN-binding protein [Streptococcus zalophi]|uniref:FMN-binding protein n=1 Tax=Streptococcus zalophi TaxID=640031 RepID=A0A934P8V6_9STRE|nr:FMN-binding protein [Streptococcus zalophi]MBJ8349087.1 FMN-binding protein [Streptococcus zalophi]MCR8967762.1 FMN-binding protein [Streptococcus zalophi]
MKKGTLLKSLALLGAATLLVACSNNSTDTKSDAEETTTTMEAKDDSQKEMMMDLQDGTYKAESEYDSHDNKIMHTIVVKDGKITESDFDYYSKDGNMRKTENEEYNKNMKEKSGVSSKESIEQLNADLLEKQSADVEVVTGATHTSENFKNSTEALLKAASEGNTETVSFEIVE